ncbi:DUF5320 domain-containing protein [Bacillota bacterium Meth-B3]
MPGRDGTGPVGAGLMTGRGFGVCSGGAPGYGAGRGAGLGLGRRGGRGCGRGFGGYVPSDRYGSLTRKEALSEHKKLLEDRLDFVNKQLDEP